MEVWRLAIRAPPSVLVAVCSLHAATAIVCLICCCAVESHHCRRWLPPSTNPMEVWGLAIRAPPSVWVAVCSLHAAAAIVCLICCCAVENHHCRRWLPPPTQPNGGVGVSHTCTDINSVAICSLQIQMC